jgi:hypothetical protein
VPGWTGQIRAIRGRLASTAQRSRSDGSPAGPVPVPRSCAPSARARAERDASLSRSGRGELTSGLEDHKRWKRRAAHGAPRSRKHRIRVRTTRRRTAIGIPCPPAVRITPGTTRPAIGRLGRDLARGQSPASPVMTVPMRSWPPGRRDQLWDRGGTEVLRQGGTKVPCARWHHRCQQLSRPASSGRWNYGQTIAAAGNVDARRDEVTAGVREARISGVSAPVDPDVPRVRDVGAGDELRGRR